MFGKVGDGNDPMSRAMNSLIATVTPQTAEEVLSGFYESDGVTKDIKGSPPMDVTGSISDLHSRDTNFTGKWKIIGD